MREVVNIYREIRAPRTAEEAFERPRHTGRYGYHDGAGVRWYQSEGTARQAVLDDGYSPGEVGHVYV